jgi:GT2 family glycosyltransferase
LLTDEENDGATVPKLATELCGLRAHLHRRRRAVNGLVGAVVIGRNEGERLRRCLQSISGRLSTVAYVDSGSSDGSLELARGMGFLAIALDPSLPFTAARARNEGFFRLLEAAPQLKFVQFVDGDCEVAEGWLERAEQEISADPTLAVVCGRRRERYPERSIYNLLCDMEWNTPIGPTAYCGGDALMRVEAVRAVGGYDPSLIAGEEPDLCIRMGELGWRVLRVDAEMTVHDAAMTRLGQWWRRELRAGHACAEGAARHGNLPGRHFKRNVFSNWLWGLVVPAVTVGLALPTGGLSLGLLVLLYARLWFRIYRTVRGRQFTPQHARLYAFYCVLGKLPQALGQALYWSRRLTGRRGQLIEYKGRTPPTRDVPLARAFEPEPPT